LHATQAGDNQVFLPKLQRADMQGVHVDGAHGAVARLCSHLGRGRAADRGVGANRPGVPREGGGRPCGCQSGGSQRDDITGAVSQGTERDQRYVSVLSIDAGRAEAGAVEGTRLGVLGEADLSQCARATRQRDGGQDYASLRLRRARHQGYHHY